MRRTKVRIVSFTVSIVLIISSFMSFSVSVYATSDDGVYEPGTSWWHKFTTEFGSIVRYAANQYNAFVKGDDFSQFLKNQEDFEEWWNTGHITYDEQTNTFTFDEDLGKYFKQALIDYANEMNEFWIVKTNSIQDLDSTKFVNRNLFLSLRYLTESYGMISANGMSSYLIVAPMSNYIENGYVFIAQNPNFDFTDLTSVLWCDMYSQEWELKSTSWYRFDINSNMPAYNDIDQGTPSSETSWLNKSVSKFGLNYLTTSGGAIYNNWSSALNVGSIITNDGCRVRVYKSLNSYKLYSVGQRAVYFGSGFYDTEVGDLTASFDDVADSMDRLDETLRDLLDKIDDNTDESKIEELLQQILDQMKDNNSGSGNGSGSGSSGSKDYTGFFGAILEYLDLIVGYLDEFFGSIFEYLDMIVEYLSGILDGIENLVFLEWTSQDEDIGDLSDIIKGIKDDPETGSQAAADYLTTSFSDIATGLTKKFPFSIPWDLYALFSVFSEVDSPQAALISSETILPYSIRDGDIQLLNGGGHSREPDIAEPEISNAPYFKLPLVIESAGINENIIIDLSGFQSVSVLSRSLFTVLFALFLLKFTLKIIPLFKGGDGD